MKYIHIFIFFSLLLNLSFSAEAQTREFCKNISGKYYNETNKRDVLILNKSQEFKYIKSTPRHLSNTCICNDYSSKGKWVYITNNIIEIVSVNFYTKEDGFDYRIMVDKINSEDSLYIDFVFPLSGFYHDIYIKINNKKIKIEYDEYSDYTTVDRYVNERINNYGDLINLESNSVIQSIALSKEAMSDCSIANNLSVTLVLDGCSYSPFYSVGRHKFDMFSTAINEYTVEHKGNFENNYNHILVVFPNFDVCFSQFEEQDHKLIYIKNEKQLFWKNSCWIKFK